MPSTPFSFHSRLTEAVQVNPARSGCCSPRQSTRALPSCLWPPPQMVTYWWPWRRSVRPFRPPMSHMMMLLSDAPEKSNRWIGSHQRQAILPRMWDRSNRTQCQDTQAWLWKPNYRLSLGVKHLFWQTKGHSNHIPMHHGENTVNPLSKLGSWGFLSHTALNTKALKVFPCSVPIIYKVPIYKKSVHKTSEEKKKPMCLQ